MIAAALPMPRLRAGDERDLARRFSHGRTLIPLAAARARVALSSVGRRCPMGPGEERRMRVLAAMTLAARRLRGHGGRVSASTPTRRSPITAPTASPCAATRSAPPGQSTHTVTVGSVSRSWVEYVPNGLRRRDRASGRHHVARPRLGRQRNSWRPRDGRRSPIATTSWCCRRCARQAIAMGPSRGAPQQCRRRLRRSDARLGRRAALRRAPRFAQRHLQRLGVRGDARLRARRPSTCGRVRRHHLPAPRLRAYVAGHGRGLPRNRGQGRALRRRSVGRSCRSSYPRSRVRSSTGPTATVARSKPADQQLSSEVTKRTFSGCRGGTTVELYIIAGGGHTWPGGAASETFGRTTTQINATEVMWKTFSRT